jgi:DNA-binding transcriptional LysR family regulator
VYALLPDLLRHFAHAHPAIQLELRSDRVDHLLTGVERGELQVALVRMSVARGNVELASWWREPLVAMLPLEHRLAGAERIELAELSEDDFIVSPAELEPDYRDWLLAICERLAFTPRVTWEIDGYLGIAGLVASGLGVSLLPGSFSRWSPPGIVFRQLSDVSEQSEVRVATRRGDRAAPTRLLLEAIRSLPGASLGSG